MNPCGSGQRLWRNRRYGPDGWGVTDGAHSWSYGREEFPLYCTHCAFMNETLPIRWIGHPVYPSDPARGLRPRPVHLVLVQGPGRRSPTATSSATGSSAARRWRLTHPTRRGARGARRGAGEDAGELELSPIEGGASRQTFVVEAGGEPRFVLRREPAEGMSFAPLELELRAIAAADLAGVAVARTVAAEPAGGRFGPAPAT